VAGAIGRPCFRVGRALADGRPVADLRAPLPGDDVVQVAAGGPARERSDLQERRVVAVSTESVTSGRGLPDDRVRGVLRRRPHRVMAADAAPQIVEAVHPGRVVRLLRLRRHSLHAAAGRRHGGQTNSRR
jgi:hypothetical protein